MCLLAVTASRFGISGGLGPLQVLEAASGGLGPVDPSPVDYLTL